MVNILNKMYFLQTKVEEQKQKLFMTQDIQGFGILIIKRVWNI